VADEGIDTLQLGGPQPLRNEPVQARSSARLDALLDAAARVVDEVGYERLTTARVAEVAGASIGTVYRYFPDRLALLLALRSRNLQRYTERLTVFFDANPGEFRIEDAIRSVDVYAEMFRTEPGFRAIRFTDLPSPETGVRLDDANGVMARYFVRRYLDGVDSAFEDELVFRLEVIVEIGESLLSRAFSDPQAVDERFIDEFREFTRNYLQVHVVDRFLTMPDASGV
jgi:AcrR family transcriptional regulator